MMEPKSALAATLALAFLIAAPARAQDVRSGVDQWQQGNHAAAVEIWRPLAAKGDADAAFNLGQAYRLGRGVPIDLARAQAMFEQAARKGHVDAATTLGILLFQNGNRTAAMRWLRTAAEVGDPRAMLLYGTALYNGDGVAPDAVTAYAYVSRSAAQGLAPASATLADLDAAMTLEQRQRGAALARTMVAGAKPDAAKAPALATPKPAAAAKPATVRSVPKPITVAASGSWRIQLGAFGQIKTAEALFARLRGKLAGREPIYVAAGKVVRLQVGPYESRATATAACARLPGQPCFAVEQR